MDTPTLGITRRPVTRRLRDLTAATLAAVLVVTLTDQPPAAAEPEVAAGPPAREWDEIAPVPVERVTGRQQPTITAPSATERPAPVWPTGGVAVTTVPAVTPTRGAAVPDGGFASPATLVEVGGLPVRATQATSGSQGPEQVRLRVFDRATTQRAGVRGVLFRVTPQDGAARLRVSVNYRRFATGYGADWASRLRLVALPECALAATGSSGCAGQPLPSHNNIADMTVAADVDLSGGPVLLAVQAAPAGPAGDYQATSLQSSSTWSAGGNSGGFTWSYPLRVPPGAGGPAPEVALSYASQSVDGRHAASNNQPSWMGEGFDLWPGGFIERRYRGCAEDMDGDANNTEETGDLCWATDNAILSLNGTSGELLYNASQDRWHLRADDGSRIERHSGASNGDNTGEYWVVTTTDGTQYWFGINRLPGWASGDLVTNSTWTAPVFGNHPGEPCHAAAFADSDCTQAWRWNLDYVVDVHGNSMSYWYTAESNRYARNLDTDDAASYTRGGYLERIAYGTRRDAGVDSILDGSAPARIVFATGDRCLSSCTTHDETRWPDTPWDQECTGSTCSDVFAPTFWTTKRLGSVTTQIWNGSSYRNVERWSFTHSFPDPGDTTRAGLWLSKIAHQGLANGTVSLPDMEFTPVSLDNRVDAIDAAPAMAWHRIARIDTETGGAIAVTYSDRDCETSKPTPHTNTRRCYPVHWTREGEQEPTLDWFHKYVVTEVREVDMVGGQPEVLHRYSYLDGAAWHYTDDDGLVDPQTKTWAVWRGYGRVGHTVGEGDTQRTYTETRFFRGMDGDKLPSGSRTVNVTDSKGGSWPDEDWFAGMIREQVTFNGPGGAEVSGQITDPWASSPTASRTINGTTVHARFTNTGTVRSRVALDGGRGERTTRVSTSFDSLGMPIQIDDHGDTSRTGDEQCTMRTFGPRNTDAWLVTVVHRIRTFAVGCDDAADPAALSDTDVISDVRTSYDGAAYGTAPTRGLTTRTEEMAAWNAGTPTYVTILQATHDAHGRALEVRDALNRPTTTAYTPATGGPVVGTTSTNPLGHTTTTTLDPAFGLTTRVVDANSKTTNLAYDGLGRLTSVWLSGRASTQTANVTFAYGVRDTDVTYVTTAKLNPFGNYVTTHTLYDGLLRQLQTQAPSPSVDGGRILTNTFYDNVGRPYLGYGAYYATGDPTTDLHVPIEPLNVPTQTRTIYDGVSRPRVEIFQPYNVERWRTSYGYGGDRTDLTPPAGAPATSTVTDARGRTVELWQYLGSAPAGDHDTTTYDYDRKGQLVGVTDPADNQWNYVYDLRGRMVESHDPDAGATQMGYDNAHQLTSTTDARGVTLAYTYDTLGRRTTTRLDSPTGTPLSRWVYDTLAKGQLARSQRFAGGQPYEVRVEGYTDSYQPTGIDVVVPGTGLGGTYSVDYTYHVDGSPDSIAWPATGDLPAEGLHYEYDPITGLPLTLRATYGTTPIQYVTNTAYNALGQVEQLTLRTGATAKAVRLGYDRELETGRLTNWWADTDTAPFVQADLRYTYDPAANITRIADLSPNPDDTQCFGYDHLRRLTEAWTPGAGDCTATRTAAALGGPAPYWLSWTYDKTGNRLTQTEHRTGGDITTTYTHPPAGGPQPHTLTSATTGGVTRNWTYGAAGHTLTRPDNNSPGQQTLTWDHEGRLSSVNQPEGGGEGYLYDPDGSRLVSTDATGRTLYLPGQEVRYDNATGTKTTTRYYTYHDQTIASRTAAGLTWLASDHQGTAQVAIDAATQQAQVRRQTPFGTSRGAQPVWPNTRGYVGGITDPTGLTHLGAREYDPTNGRFISVDPILNLDDPQQMHGYSYANNNPTTWSDPTGLSCVLVDGLFCPSGGNTGSGSGPSSGSSGDNKPNAPSPADTNTDDGGPPFCTTRVNCHQEIAEEVAGVFRGMGEQFADTVVGMWDYAFECVRIYGNRQGCDQAIAKNLIKDPSQVWHSIWDPIAEDWKNGNYGEAIGRVAFLVIEAALGTKGAGAAARAFIAAIKVGAKTPTPHAPNAPDAPNAPSRPGATACSFSATTLVLMADGTTKPISEIVPGDQVLTYDPETGEQMVETVLAVSAHEDTLVELQVMQSGLPAIGALRASADARMVTVATTADHPFWNHTDQQWQPAALLSVGDLLHTADRTRSAVIGLLAYTERDATAYNLTIANLHTYYVLVGNTPVLVHNDGAPPPGPHGDRIFYRNYSYRLDPVPGGSGQFEIHVYHRGTEVGFFGSNGWFDKHGLRGSSAINPADLAEVERSLKGISIDYMRRSGLLAPGDGVQGDDWMRPRC